MARLRTLYGPTAESRKAEKLAKLITEDFAVDLERVGYYLVRNLPLIVYRRFEVISLSAGEEYDKLMLELTGGRPNDLLRR